MFAIRSLIAAAAMLVVAVLFSVNPWSKRTAGDSLGVALHQAANRRFAALADYACQPHGRGLDETTRACGGTVPDGTYEIVSGRPVLARR